MQMSRSTFRSFHEMNSAEMWDTWDDETTDSWSEITRDGIRAEKVPDEQCVAIERMRKWDNDKSLVNGLDQESAGNDNMHNKNSTGSNNLESPLEKVPLSQIVIPISNIHQDYSHSFCNDDDDYEGGESSEGILNSSSSFSDQPSDLVFRKGLSGSTAAVVASAIPLQARFSDCSWDPTDHSIQSNQQTSTLSTLPEHQPDGEESNGQSKAKERYNENATWSNCITELPKRFLSHSKHRRYLSFSLWWCIMVVSAAASISFSNTSSLLPSHLVKNLLTSSNNESLSTSYLSSLSYLTLEKKRPGFQLAQQGARAKYPLVIVPGFVTSGLEVWGGKECARNYFRQRMWAAMVGARSFLTDRDCWRQHMMLDPKTGGDPEGIRLRAASGFQAVDYFMANYWVFGKIIENLADVGYTPSEMAVEAYDWRLAFPLLEQRDGYFTNLKNRIETMRKISNQKVVITSHSMGGLVVHYFFAWVTSPRGGNGGKNWVDRHVHAYVNIAGCHLGVPKAITALLSGEMSDTVVIMNPLASAVEQFFGRKLRRELWNTWGSIWAMIPKGGDALWNVGADMCNPNPDGGSAGTKSSITNGADSGNNDADDPFCPNDGNKLSHILAVRNSKEEFDRIGSHPPASYSSEQDNGDTCDWNSSAAETASPSPTLSNFLARRDFTLNSVIDFVQEHGSASGLANAKLYHLYSSSSDPTARAKEEPAWHDPSQTPLPRAPKMKIYCLYGVGKPTERAYYYKLNRPDPQPSSTGNATNNNNNMNNLDSDPPLILDSEVSYPEVNVERGVKYTDGDGSVPLLSLGYLCADAWTRPSSGLNPSNATIYTREYRHRPEFAVDDPMRSGPNSGDHVDVLGNVDLTEDLLRILTDWEVEEKVNQNRIHSQIIQIAQDINAKGGIFKRGKRKR